MKKFVKSFTIDMKKWGRATETSSPSGLLRNPVNGKQCCLGIYLSACGFSDEELDDEPGVPKSALSSQFWNSKFPVGDVEVPNETGYLQYPVDVARDLASTNDEAMKLAERKKLIAAGFKKLGVRVKFKS